MTDLDDTTVDALVADAERRGYLRGRAEVVARVEAVLQRIENSTAIPIGWEAATRSTVSIASVRAALADPGDAQASDGGEAS